jgi:hypothetical protein
MPDSPALVDLPQQRRLCVPVWQVALAESNDMISALC